MINQSDSTLPRADRWSRIGMIVGLAGALTVAVGDLVVYLYAPGNELIVRPLHTVVVVGLAALVVSSVAVQVGVHLVRGQRRLEARLARLAGEPEPGQAVDNVVAFELGRKAARATAPTVLP